MGTGLTDSMQCTLNQLKKLYHTRKKKLDTWQQRTATILQKWCALQLQQNKRQKNGVPIEFHVYLQHTLTQSTAALWISNEFKNSCRLATLTHQLYPQIIHRSMLPLKWLKGSNWICRTTSLRQLSATYLSWVLFIIQWHYLALRMFQFRILPENVYISQQLWHVLAFRDPNSPR